LLFLEGLGIRLGPGVEGLGLAGHRADTHALTDVVTITAAELRAVWSRAVELQGLTECLVFWEVLEAHVIIGTTREPFADFPVGTGGIDGIREVGLRDSLDERWAHGTRTLETRTLGALGEGNESRGHVGKEGGRKTKEGR
jgi:hypothetical protein